MVPVSCISVFVFNNCSAITRKGVRGGRRGRGWEEKDLQCSPMARQQSAGGVSVLCSLSLSVSLVPRQPFSLRDW